MLEVAMRADAAEARGDARAALDELSSMLYGPDGAPFWRPWRLRRLSQLFAYDGHLPRWATSRWILEQALQALNHDARDRTSRALRVAIDIGAADLLPPGLDDREMRCRVMDRDWVFRQVFLYELGGLEAFVRTTAAPGLIVAADDLQAWTRSPIDAYRLVGSDSLRITWEQLGTGRLVEVDNLGSALLLLPGQHVIGRLVPVEGGEMFETVPLLVTEAVAKDVAVDPSSWIDVLRDASPDDEVIRTSGFSFGLLHDIHPLVLEAVLGGDGGLCDNPHQPDELVAMARMVLALVRHAFGPSADPGLSPDREPDDIDLWPCLAAALLEPVLLAHVSRSVHPGDAAAFEALSHALPEPAAAVCRTVVQSCRAVA